MPNLETGRVAALLNQILEQELAGVVRYTHYSFLVFGHSRIPIVSWLRDQANESLLHAHQAGEMITHLGAYPSLNIGPLLDHHLLSIDTILREALAAEATALDLYRALLEEVTGKSIMLEEYARQMILAEELHAGEVNKMLRRPGSIAGAGVVEDPSNHAGPTTLAKGQSTSGLMQGVVPEFGSERLDAALQDPSACFRTPAEVVDWPGISVADKIRILRRWEYDVREEEVAQEENMTGDLPVALSDVLDAMNRLHAAPGHQHLAPTKQGGQ